MAGWASYDDLISEMTVNDKFKVLNFHKVFPSLTGTVSYSLWTADGNPGAGSAPATTPGDTYTNAGMFVANQTPDKKAILALKAVASAGAMSLVLYDRLAAVSGIAMNSTGNKTISTAALPRYNGTDAAGNEVWLEVTTAGTTTAPIVTLNDYTNQDGTPNRAATSSQTFPTTTLSANFMVALPLQQGDTGVRAVATINVGTAGGGSGVCNLVILRRLAHILIPIGDYVTAAQEYTLGLPPPIEIKDGASLGLIAIGSTTANTYVRGTIVVGWG